MDAPGPAPASTPAEGGAFLQVRALFALFATPFFLGLAPIFGKFALEAGADPFSVAAVRTAIAALLLWALFGLFFRRYLVIYPAGLLGCIIIGTVNGIGSLFYYSGLGLLNASLVQLINGLYIVIALLMARAGGEQLDRRILVRVGLAMLALVCIAGLSGGSISPLGVALMFGSAVMFAATFVLSQYVLYEMPSPTATVYILSTMAVIVLVVWGAVGRPLSSTTWLSALPAILVLGITTALSRLTMFASVQRFGSIRTAVNAAGEIGVSLVLAFVFLGDRLTAWQVAGVALLIGSISLIRGQDLIPRTMNFKSILIRDLASVQFQRIAFHRAFGRPEDDNEFNVMSTITTAELQAIQKMMGAREVADPFSVVRESDALADSAPAEDARKDA
jgi:drug/metabolite transporter (DMT)-like permease